MLGLSFREPENPSSEDEIIEEFLKGLLEGFRLWDVQSLLV